MEALDSQSVRTVQLDVLQAIDGFCRREGLRYSLACGTMLGAVRHRGYIPWDDDIDIYMVFSMNFSSLMFQRAPTEGKVPYLWPRPNAVLPSVRTLASMEYLLLYE